MRASVKPGSEDDKANPFRLRSIGTEVDLPPKAETAQFSIVTGWKLFRAVVSNISTLKDIGNSKGWIRRRIKFRFVSPEFPNGFRSYMCGRFSA